MSGAPDPTGRLADDFRPGRLRWVPWMFVAGFAVVIIANGTLVAFALGTWSGVTERHHYRVGLAYNAHLAEKSAAAALGWQTALGMSGPMDATRLTLDVRDADGAPVTGAVVVADIARPTHQGHDFRLAFVELENGRYRATAGFPLPGQWSVRPTISLGADTLTATKRIHVRP